MLTNLLLIPLTTRRGFEPNANSGRKKHRGIAKTIWRSIVIKITKNVIITHGVNNAGMADPAVKGVTKAPK